MSEFHFKISVLVILRNSATTSKLNAALMTVSLNPLFLCEFFALLLLFLTFLVHLRVCFLVWEQPFFLEVLFCNNYSKPDLIHSWHNTHLEIFSHGFGFQVADKIQNPYIFWNRPYSWLFGCFLRRNYRPQLR